jgi:hypothetical protein
MNDADFRYIEEKLGGVLPNAFKQLMASTPSHPDHWLGGNHAILPCSREKFVDFQSGDGFSACANDHCGKRTDFYELQPELRSRKFMCVDGDGCGNYFCMAGDDVHSQEVWQWEHDPYTGFSIEDDWMLCSLLAQPWQLIIGDDCYDPNNESEPFNSAHPLYPSDTLLAENEWRQFVNDSEVLTLDEHVRVEQSPFTGEDTELTDWRSRAKLRLDGESAHLHFAHGSLRLDGVMPTKLSDCAKGIASNLNAKLWH